MKLSVVRNLVTLDANFGEFSVDGVPFCKTMERTIVMIPTGTYNVIMEYSPHFDRITPHIQVPGRTFIEIHPANFPQQLEGCIALGYGMSGDGLVDSRHACDDLMAKLQNQSDITIDII